MSTKIYDGMKTNVGTLPELFTCAQTLRRELYDAYRQVFGAEWARLVERGEETHGGGSVFGVLQKAQQRAATFKDVHDFSVSGVFLHAPSHNVTLFLLFAGQEEYWRVVRESPFLESYGYWDNTDREDGVTEEEWAERKAVWSEALAGFYGSPAEQGLCFTFGELNHARVAWDVIDRYPAGDPAGKLLFADMLKYRTAEQPKF